jgi:hypothetical protein
VEVEDRLFKVMRHPFLESEIFKFRFNLQSREKDAKSCTDDSLSEDVISLQGTNVKADDFQALVKAMTRGMTIMNTK